MDDAPAEHEAPSLRGVEGAGGSTEPTRNFEEEPVAPSGNEEAGTGSRFTSVDVDSHHSIMTADVERQVQRVDLSL